jgi:hypothetical protein
LNDVARIRSSRGRLTSKVPVDFSDEADDHDDQGEFDQISQVASETDIESNESNQYLRTSKMQLESETYEDLSSETMLAKSFQQENSQIDPQNINSALPGLDDEQAEAFGCKDVHAELFWLLLAWTIHFGPFLFMKRVLYFHHYMPAFMISTILTANVGVVWV